MFVVDKWNQLVMKLSPNLASVQNILGLKEDINEAPRAYLNQQEVSIPTNSDLKIETFYDEIMYESASPLFNPINSNLEIDSELAPIPLGEVEIPNNVIEEINEKMPDNYIPDFFRRLKEKQKCQDMQCNKSYLEFIHELSPPILENCGLIKLSLPRLMVNYFHRLLVRCWKN